MEEPSEYMEQVVDALGAQLNRETGELSLDWSYDTFDGVKRARSEMVMHQKKLRAIKRNVNSDLRTIRDHYKAEADSVEAGLLTTMFGGKKRAGQERAQKKREIMAKRDAILEPYKTVKGDIDTIHLELDKAKLDVDEFIKQELSGQYQDDEVVAKILAGEIWVGQTAEMVTVSRGSPQAVDQKVLKTKKKEVWKYGHKGANRYKLRITLDNDEVVAWDVKDN